MVEYPEHLPLTVRQIFYRLVGAHGYAKTENAYSRLGEHVNRGRRAGLIQFEAIRDDGATVSEPPGWDDVEQLVQTFYREAQLFRLDRQAGQPAVLYFAVEAAGMLPQVKRIADPFGISVQFGGGFNSTSSKHSLAKRLGRHARVEVLHVGDHDPSGVHLFSSMAEDVQTLGRDLGFHTTIQFSRLAVTSAQIAELDLPTAAPKETDRRSFDGRTTQVESIPPDVLANIIQAAIEDRLDRGAYDRVLANERAAREALTERLLPLRQR